MGCWRNPSAVGSASALMRWWPSPWPLSGQRLIGSRWPSWCAAFSFTFAWGPPVSDVLSPDVAEAIEHSRESHARHGTARPAWLFSPDYRGLSRGRGETARLPRLPFEAWRGLDHRAVGGWGWACPQFQQRRHARVFRKRSTRIARASAEALSDHLGAFEIGTDAGRNRPACAGLSVSRLGVHCTEVDLSARCCMVTLTYRHHHGLAAESHSVVRGHRPQVPQPGRRPRFRYCWVAELQKRGAIHYHLALWLPADVSLPKPDPGPAGGSTAPPASRRPATRCRT